MVSQHDQRKLWDMQSDGTYVQRDPDGDASGCQTLLIEAAERRHFEATRLRKRKPRGIARRLTT